MHFLEVDVDMAGDEQSKQKVDQPSGALLQFMASGALFGKYG